MDKEPPYDDEDRQGKTDHYPQPFGVISLTFFLGEPQNRIPIRTGTHPLDIASMAAALVLIIGS